MEDREPRNTVRPQDRAEVIYSKTGVASVRASDILRSTRGQEEIRRAAELAANLGLQPAGTKR